MSNPNIKYKVYLTPTERKDLTYQSRNGHASAKRIIRARVLLMADQEHPEGRWKDAQISEALGIHINTVARIRKSFVKGGIESALTNRQRQTPPVEPILDGEKHAHLVAICCENPPSGRVRWTLSLLVEELKRRGIVVNISRETVRQSLKKTSGDLGKSSATAFRKMMRRVS